MKTAFVTGATGFIGSHLVEELQRRGYGEIRCLVRTERKWLEGMDIVEIRGDLFDEKVISDAVKGVDFVYHVGGVTRAKDWETFERANVRATIRLIETVANVNPEVEKILVTSSLAAVGKCRSGVASESSPLKPISRYGRSKALMEQELGRLERSVPVVIVRPPAVYGPREADIYTFFEAANKGICPVVGDPNKPVLSLVHVDDLVKGMADAAEAPSTAGETYFLGSEDFYSWNEVKDATKSALNRWMLTIAVPPRLVGILGAVSEVIGRVSGKYPPLNREKAREIRHTCKMCRIDKAARDFGYRPTVPLDRGIADTIAWYKREGWL